MSSAANLPRTLALRTTERLAAQQPSPARLENRYPIPGSSSESGSGTKCACYSSRQEREFDFDLFHPGTNDERYAGGGYHSTCGSYGRRGHRLAARHINVLAILAGRAARKAI